MEPAFSTFGALIGLALAIALIVRKAPPAYALVLGALAGGLLGGGGPESVVRAMVDGAKGMTPSVLRILASGILAGALIRTGSAASIAGSIVRALGPRFALPAVALATAVICAVGVFIDVAVITVAPVALAVAARTGLPVSAVLLAMIGGGKAGNVVSPNPNTIAAADAFKVDLTSLMGSNFLPACAAFAVTVLLAAWLARRDRAVRGAAGAPVRAAPPDGDERDAVPSPAVALAGPVTVVALLALRPLCGFAVDPLLALPAGGIVTILCARRARDAREIAEFGLSKVAGVAILLVGTGTIAGVVKASGLNADVTALLNSCHLPSFALAPVSGILLAGATASTTAGATVASQTFAPALLSAGVPSLAAAAMIHAGATVADSLPHGSFFHATGGAVFMDVRARMKLLPFEVAVGLTTTVAAVALHAV